MIESLNMSLVGVVDSEGRPLLELADPRLGDSVPVELAPCPYRGSRYQHVRPMNLSALKQVRAHWRAARAGMAYLRALSARRPEAPLTYPGLWRVAVYVESLPRYLQLSAQAERRDLILPPHVGAMYKIALGLSSAVLAVIQTRLSAETLSENADPEDLCAFVEDQGLLIGRHQVCAGSEEMIRDVVGLLCAPATEVDRVAARATAELIREEAFLAFGSHLVNVSVLSSLSLFVMDSIYEILRSTMSSQIGRDDVFARIDGRSAGLASLTWESMGSLVDMLVTGLVDLRVAPPVLRARLLDLKSHFRPLSEEQGDSLRKLLELHGALDPTPLLPAIGVYLRWEQALDEIGRLLQEGVAEAIGVGDGANPWARDPVLAPPTPRVRSLLSAVYGMRFRPGCVVQVGLQKLRLAGWVQ